MVAEADSKYQAAAEIAAEVEHDVANCDAKIKEITGQIGLSIIMIVVKLFSSNIKIVSLPSSSLCWLGSMIGFGGLVQL